MKNLLLVVCVLIGSASYAHDFKTTFYELLNDRAYERAESLLAEWEASNSADSELYPARFNLYLNQARYSGLILDSETDPEGEALMFADSLGNVAGSIRGYTTWNDSLVNLAFRAIDEGIVRHPDRLDFRFGRATACSYIDNWTGLNTIASEVLKRGSVNNFRWLWTDDEILDSAESLNRMLEGIHEFERTLAANSDPYELLDLNLKYFPDDHIALTLKGALYFEDGRINDALEAMKKANLAALDDMLIVCNLAYLYREMGDDEKALALYQSVLDNNSAEDEWTTLAREMILRMTTPVK